MRILRFYLLGVLFCTALGLRGQSFEWAKSFGGISVEQGQSITIDPFGNIYTAGIFGDTVDFDPGTGAFNLVSAGSRDMFIQKLDSNGNFLWAKSIGGTLDDNSRSIAVDASGNVYATGLFQGTVDFDPGPGIANFTSAGFYDLFVLKLDASGNFIWAESIGGTSYDQGNAITLDVSGNVYITGYFGNTVDFDPGSASFNLMSLGSNDIFVLKLDSLGNFLWAKSFGGIGIDRANSIAFDPSGNVYTTGYFSGTVDFDPGTGTNNLVSAGDYDFFIQKLDSLGNFLWANSIGSSSADQGLSITVGVSGNVYSTGYFGGVVDFDPGSGTFNLVSAGNADIFVQKLDPSGNFIWAKSFGSTGPDLGLSICTDSFNNIYTTGFFEGTIDFNPGAGIVNLISAGFRDIFIQKMDDSGNFIYAQSFGSTGADEGLAICTDNTESIYTTGNFLNTADFNQGPGTFNLISNGSSDAFIYKSRPCSPDSSLATITSCDSYTWQANGQNYTSSGNYAATLINWVGCDSVIHLNLTINSSTSASASADICQGENYFFGSQTLNTAGTYTETFTSQNGCDSVVTLTLTVNTVDTSVVVTGNTLTVNVTGAFYQWIDCDNGNTPILGETNQSFTPTQNGNYAVIVTENNCSDTSECFSVIVIGLSDTPQSKILLYPNPTDDRLFIELNQAQEVRVSVIDMKGITVKKQTLKGKTLELSIKDLPTAHYLIKIQGEGVDISTGMVKK